MKYFVKDSDMVWKEFIATEENLVERAVLANTVRAPKDCLEDIDEYVYEGMDSDAVLDLDDAREYVFLDVDELTTDEIDFLVYGGIRLEELELLEYMPKECFDQLNTEEYEEWKNIIEKYLEQSIIAKMHAYGYDANLLATYTAYRYWDGSNIREVILEDEQGFTDWSDYTDEFAGMEEVERKQENTGHYVLYQLKDDSKILVYVSYWQGDVIDSLAFLPSGIQNIDEAIEYVKKEVEKYYGGYDGI